MPASINKQLISAIKQNDYEQFVELMQKKPNIHIYNDAALREAVVVGSYHMVLALIEAGANISVQNNYPLNNAFYHNHYYIAKLLIAKGADFQSHSRYYLEQSVINNSPDCVELCISEGCDVNALQGSSLRWAVKNENAQIVKMLLEAGADASVIYIDDKWVTKSGEFRKGKQEIGELLRQYGGLTFRNNKERIEALVKDAIEKGDKEKAQNLYAIWGKILPSYFFPNILTAAAQEENLKLVNGLLKLGVKADSEVLFWAAAYEHEDVCNLLLAHGAKLTEEIERMLS